MPCGFESHLSHQISPNPIWDLEIFLFAREMGLERPLRKHAGGMFFRPWESPSKSRCIRYGCRWILNMSDFEKVLVRAHFFKSPIRTLAPKNPDIHPDIWIFLCSDGTLLSKMLRWTHPSKKGWPVWASPLLLVTL